MKFKRLLINGLLAATFGLSAVAVETGAFNSLATIAFADGTTIPASVGPVTQSNASGSKGTVSGTYSWSSDASFTITVTKVDNTKTGVGRITQVLVKASTGQSQTYGTGTSVLTSFQVLNTGLTMTFGSSTLNKVNDWYKFSATARHKCDDGEGQKSRCNGGDD